MNLVTAIVYAHYSGHVRDLLHIHTKRRGTAMNRVYRILSNSYGVYSKKEKQIPKTPSNVLSHVSVDTKTQEEEEEKISQNDHDTIELAALSPKSRRGKAISFKDDEDDREVRGVRAWSSRMSLFHVSVMLLKLRKYHSYHSLISARKSLEKQYILVYDEYLTRASRSNTGTFRGVDLFARFDA